MTKIKSRKSNLHYTRLIPFRVSRVSGAHLRGFAPQQGPYNQGCNGGESLATYGRFDRLGIWTSYLPHQKRTSHHLCYLAGDLFSYLHGVETRNSLTSDEKHQSFVEFTSSFKKQLFSDHHYR